MNTLANHTDRALRAAHGHSLPPSPSPSLTHFMLAELATRCCCRCVLLAVHHDDALCMLDQRHVARHTAECILVWAIVRASSVTINVLHCFYFTLLLTRTASMQWKFLKNIVSGRQHGFSMEK